MIKRPPVPKALTLGALAVALAASTGLAGVTGVQSARAQTAPPAIADPADDTALGALDTTGLGAPLDETNQPPTDNPAPVDPGAPGTPAPAQGTPGAATGGTPPASLPPIQIVINVPNAPSGGSVNAAPKKKATTKKKATKKKATKKKHRTKHKRKPTHKRAARRG